MQLQILRNADELEEIADEWNDLLAHSASHVPFLRNEYLSAWWKTLGGGEWAQGELFVVTSRQENGRLCGIAPLFFTPNRDGEAALMLLGSIEISDYLDLITPQANLPQFLGELFAFLAGPYAPAWKVLDWYNLLEDSPTLEALPAAAAPWGWTVHLERLQHCPYISLPGDWETYLAGIDKKQRHEIRRKMRRAESSEAQVRWYIVEDEATLEAEVDDFLDLMSQDAEKQAFLTRAMRDQMHATALAAFRSNWLQLAFLTVNGEKAAGYLNFDYGNHIWVYNSGLNYSLGELSPGWVLLGNLLQWANEQKRAAFDFMRGNEDYKYRFGGIDRFVVRARVRR